MPIKDWTDLPYGDINDWTDMPDSPHLEEQKKEPDTWLGGFTKSITSGDALKAGLEGLGGYARGAIADLPESVFGAAKTAAGLMSFGNPQKQVQTAQELIGGVKQLPSHIAETTKMAGSQPHEFGRMMGQLTGQPIVGEGLARGLPKVIPEVGPSLNRLAQSEKGSIEWKGPTRRDAPVIPSTEEAGMMDTLTKPAFVDDAVKAVDYWDKKFNDFTTAGDWERAKLARENMTEAEIVVRKLEQDMNTSDAALQNEVDWIPEDPTGVPETPIDSAKLQEFANNAPWKQPPEPISPNPGMSEEHLDLHPMDPRHLENTPLKDLQEYLTFHGLEPEIRAGVENRIRELGGELIDPNPRNPNGPLYEGWNWDKDINDTPGLNLSQDRWNIPSGKPRQINDIVEDIVTHHQKGRDDAGLDRLLDEADGFIEAETDPKLIEENYDQLNQELEWRKLHGTPDEIEAIGNLRDLALDKLRRIKQRPDDVSDIGGPGLDVAQIRMQSMYPPMA